MNRATLDNVQHLHRGIDKDDQCYKSQLATWTTRILDREPVVPDGYAFTWRRDLGDSATNTAYLYDAVMCNLQYAQRQLHSSKAMVGKQAYVCALDGAKSLSFVLTELLPKWSFRPLEVYRLPDTHVSDIYGHYCLARAIAYDNVGKADMVGTRSARIAAASNAAHLYAVAAQLIGGDHSGMIQRAQVCTGKALEEWGTEFLDRWDKDTDSEGAAKALACYTEANAWYTWGGHAGCSDHVRYATERNHVHWIEPKLPPWNALLKPRVTALR